jgi:hypothetical protein
MTTVVEFLSDHLNFRGSFATGLALVAAISYILLGTSTTVAVRYSAFFLSVQIFINVALLLMWVGKTHVTNSKRGRALHVIGDRKDGTGMSWGEKFPQYRCTVSPREDVGFVWSVSLDICLLLCRRALLSGGRIRKGIGGMVRMDTGASMGNDKRLRYII